MNQIKYIFLSMLIFLNGCQLILPPMVTEEVIENIEKQNESTNTLESIFYNYIEIENDEILILMDTSGSQNNPLSNNNIIPFIHGNLEAFNSEGMFNFAQATNGGIDSNGNGSHIMNYYNNYWFLKIPIPTTNLITLSFLPCNYQIQHWASIETNYWNSIGKLNNRKNLIEVIISNRKIISVRTHQSNKIANFNDEYVNGIAIPANQKVIRLGLTNMGDWEVNTNSTTPYQDPSIIEVGEKTDYSIKLTASVFFEGGFDIIGIGGKVYQSSDGKTFTPGLPEINPIVIASNQNINTNSQGFMTFIFYAETNDDQEYDIFIYGDNNGSPTDYFDYESMKYFFRVTDLSKQIIITNYLPYRSDRDMTLGVRFNYSQISNELFDANGNGIPDEIGDFYLLGWPDSVFGGTNLMNAPTNTYSYQEDGVLFEVNIPIDTPLSLGLEIVGTNSYVQQKEPGTNSNMLPVVSFFCNLKKDTDPAEITVTATSNNWGQTYNAMISGDINLDTMHFVNN